MEFRCSPYIPLIFVGILGMLIFCSLPSSAQSQCNGNFTYQAVSTVRGSSSGKIVISIANPETSAYTFKVYKVAQKITLAQTKEVYSQEEITFDGLEQSTYYIKIEWGDGCYRTIGGLDGIIITEKQEGK
jgi:hypothetical protein